MKIEADLVLRGSSLDFPAIIEKMNITPDKTFRKNEPVAPRILPTHPLDGLEISTGWIDSCLVEEAVDALLEKLTAARIPVRQIINQFALQAEISCVVESPSQIPAISFSAQQLQTLAEMGVDLDIDIIVCSA